MGTGPLCATCGHPRGAHSMLVEGIDPDTMRVCLGPKVADGTVGQCDCKAYELPAPPPPMYPIQVTIPVERGCLVITHGMPRELVQQMSNELQAVVGHSDFVVVNMDADARANVLTLEGAIEFLARVKAAQ